MDRETLVKLLGGREDLSEEQVNQLIDQVQESINSIVKAPQRLASRAQKQVLDFEANLESYLRNTNKEELNPEAHQARSASVAPGSTSRGRESGRSPLEV